MFDMGLSEIQISKHWGDQARVEKNRVSPCSVGTAATWECWLLVAMGRIDLLVGLGPLRMGSGIGSLSGFRGFQTVGSSLSGSGLQRRPDVNEKNTAPHRGRFMLRRLLRIFMALI